MTFTEAAIQGRFRDSGDRNPWLRGFLCSRFPTTITVLPYPRHQRCKRLPRLD